MKTAAKVFIIIGMVIGFWMILPLIFGGLAISKINSATQKEELVGFGVCALLFCSMIGGILMLCIPESELQPATANSAPIQNNNYITNTKDDKTSKSDVENVADSLTKLKNLRDAGTISDEEFEKMKKDLLNKI